MSRYSRPPNSSLFVRNVPDGTRPEELRSLFAKYGPITDVYIPLDYYTRRTRGFAYIQFEDVRDAEDAIYALDRTRFFGRELEIEFAQGDRKTPSEMRNKERGPRRPRSPYYGSRYDDYRSSRRRSRSRSPYYRDRSPGYSRRRRSRYSYSRSRSRTPRSRSRSRDRRRHSHSPHRSRSHSHSHSPQENDQTRLSDKQDQSPECPADSEDERKSPE
ncbi:serine/arginine-rich splicing factor 12-like [Centruroides vittatus]|uniref:serine/arginine-rich splicing factor 12-like n=1 Tax=Centruroides sculpturatus TaxID=218467 RepID=UPI000C6DD876|nr:serine/arginine-rich splicing factor 12-like [Centruroides sculpturatus]